MALYFQKYGNLLMEERYCYQGTTRDVTYTHKDKSNVCICAYTYMHAFVSLHVCIEKDKERFGDR